MIASVSRPPIDWFAISPSLILLIAAGVCLMVAVLAPEAKKRATAASVTAAAFVGAFVAAVLLYDRTPIGMSVIADTVRRDRYFALGALILAAVGVVAVLVSYTERIEGGHIPEYYALLATAAAGMMFLIQANSLLTLFLGLEWFSISLYILCAIDYGRERSLEAGLKYLIVGGFGSAVLLFGSALVYGATGKLTFDGIASCGHGRGTPARRDPAHRTGDDHRRARVQGVRGAVPPVDARRLRGLADVGDGVHGGRDQGRCTAPDAAGSSSPRSRRRRASGRSRSP